MNSTKIAIFGVGGVGGYFGASLARAGYPVVMIARGEHLKAIRRHGLHVQTPKEEFTVVPAQATGSAAEVGPVDAIVLGVKAWQIPEAAAAIRPMLGPATSVLPLQNGVEAVDQLLEALGPQHVVAGLCRIISTIVAPGAIRVGGLEPTIILGEPGGGPLSANARALADAFKAARVIVQTPADIRAALWEKLLFIAALSGTGSVTRSTIGEMRQCGPTRRLLQQLMEEVSAVAAREGVHLADDIVARTLAFVDSIPAEGTASMQRDIAGGRPSELEAIIGVVVRRGKALSVPTPAHEFIYASLLPQENRARAR